MKPCQFFASCKLIELALRLWWPIFKKTDNGSVFQTTCMKDMLPAIVELAYQLPMLYVSMYSPPTSISQKIHRQPLAERSHLQSKLVDSFGSLLIL